MKVKRRTNSSKEILIAEDQKRLQRRVAQITTLSDWKRVRILLGLSDFDKTEHDNHDVMSSCVLEMFNKWLMMDTSFCTYEEGLEKLSSKLDMVGEKVLANQLKQECGN